MKNTAKQTKRISAIIVFVLVNVAIVPPFTVK